MIHVYADASYDPPICSCGYILTRSAGADEQFLDTGCRVLNTEADDSRIDWCASRAEYRALITAVRAALDWTSEALMVYTDNESVTEAIQSEETVWEAYFPHAFHSFVERFRDWHVTDVPRERNKLAHEQARIGLKLGRDIMNEVDG